MYSTAVRETIANCYVKPDGFCESEVKHREKQLSAATLLYSEIFSRLCNCQGTFKFTIIVEKYMLDLGLA